MPSESKKVPAAALQFTVGACEFGDNGENAKTAPIKMKARSGEPIVHWYWGKVAHDMKGMKLAKERLPIDYAHLSDEVLGYLNKFDVQGGDLMCSGALIPFKEGDRASEVIFKAKNGVPYEASINFGGGGKLRIQNVGENEVTEVNGKKFEGPGIIIREWTLRGVAVCPYGADHRTSSTFTQDADNLVDVEIFSENAPMPEQTKPAEAAQLSTDPAKPVEGAKPTELAQPAVDAGTKNDPATANPPEAATQQTQGAAVEGGTKPAEAAPATPPAAATQQSQPAPASTGPAVDAAKLADYIATFGDIGGRWLSEGKSKDECFKLALAAKDQQVAQLNDQVTALRGDKGVSSGADAAATEPAKAPAENPRVKELSGKLGDNLARVAAGMKFAQPAAPQKK